MIRKLLAGTDGSDSAELALRRALSVAQSLKAELHVATVCSPDLAQESLPPGGETPMMIAEQIASGVLRRHAGSGVTLEASSEVGDPADKLCQIAEDQDVDLIVVGNQGMGGSLRFRLGSVPNKVSHRAPCSVLVVETTAGIEPTPYATIVAGTDGSARAGRALATAAEIAQAAGARLILVYAGKAERGREVLAEAERAFGAVATMSRIVDAEPAAALIDTAEAEDAGLIVVGNKGMTGAARFFLGSVPDKITHHAMCDVLVVDTA
ncbi:MAG: universal stress protein [Actinomycetota bacterium]